MSDLETPEADMMRDQGSVDAARATLRPEESRPGLDPDNPGAAPDTTLDQLAGYGSKHASEHQLAGSPYYLSEPARSPLGTLPRSRNRPAGPLVWRPAFTSPQL
jgi:hypothetical protein